MTIYRFNQGSLIDEVTFRESERGAYRAYLHVRPDVDTGTIEKIIRKLRAAEHECIPYTLDGKPTLEVRGFPDKEKFLGSLGSWIKGPTLVIKEKADEVSLWDKFRKRTLQLTGLTYFVGDIGFLKYGWKEADKLVMAGAFSYFIGTLSLVFYGRNDQSDIQLKDMANDFQSFLAHENIHCSEGSALYALTVHKKTPTLKSLDEFCKRYPSEIFNTVTALAGVFIGISAYKNKVLKAKLGADPQAVRKMLQEGWMDVGLGTLTAASGTMATLVKEKKPDPDDPPTKGFAWIWEKIRAHPLAIAGGGYTIATLCHAGSTVTAYKEAKRLGDTERLKSVPFRALFVGMAFLSEFLLAISSKGHGEGVTSDASVNKSVISLAADLIVMQPKIKQDHFIKTMSKFMSRPDALAMKDDDVARQLRMQVEALRNNPWSKAEDIHHAAPAAPGTSGPGWEDRLAARAAVGLPPQLSA